MSHCSNNNSPNKPPRFTTTAIINCSAYPPDTSTQKRIITQTKSLEDEISSSCAGKSSSSANGHVKSSQFTDHTFPRKVSVGESATEAERVTLKKPFGGVPSAPPPPPSLPKSVPSNGESASTHPRLFPNSRFAQTTNSLPRGYSPKFSGASNMSNASTLRSAGTGNSFGVGVGHKVVVPGSSSEAPQKVNNAPKNLGFGASNASGIAKNGGFNSGTNATNNFKIATNSNIKSGVNNSNSNSNNKPKADPNDPQVRRLVYNMYRGLLDNKHAHSNNIIDSKPSLQVDTDEGVKNRVLSMMKQQEELKAGKTSTMNGPAGPPPPPPPPPFVVPGATPPPVVQAPPMTSRAAPRPGPPQVPLVAPPAALAGAMMKDKKPFTYTPGGLDLSEISPAPAPDTTPVQSRSFRVLQQVVDSEVSEPQAVDNGPKGTLQQQQQQPRGFGNNSNAIPSRAFRALQQQTGNGDAAAPHPSASSCHPSLSSSSSISFHPSSHPSPSSVNFNIGNKSADNPGASPENHPEQTGKNTGSQIIVNSGIKPKNVNSALSKNREASPSRWQVNTSNVTHNETPRASSPLVEEQSRLLKFIGEEAAENANKSGTPTMEPKKLYGGAKIPSRVFKHLQTEFSNTSTSTQPGARHARENSSPVGGDKPQLSAGLLRLLQSDQDKLQQDQRDGKGSSVSSSRGNINEYYSNGVANTAARKESVLRELTTQFDPSTECRKPKAAPGKVFRYLQQHYDNTDDSSASQPINNADIGKKSGLSTYISDTEHQPKSSRFHSPSFSVLQNQYRNEEASPSNGLKSVTRRISLEKPSDSDPHDLTSLRITEEGDLPQSKPYVGKRVPGKTFRMLQENYANHPSVLQARK